MGFESITGPNFALAGDIDIASTSISPSSQVVISGTSTTYDVSQNNINVIRNNSGSAMADTLPGSSVGLLPANTLITITNGDASALMSIVAASGATLKGNTFNGFLYLGPGQTLEIQSDGSNYWSISAPLRPKLGANTTFFVATTGSDSNNGTIDSTPFLTIQEAWNLVAFFDFNAFTATIQLADGTYSQGSSTLALTGNIPGQASSGILGQSGVGVILQGNLVTPTNVVISSTNDIATISIFDTPGVLFQGFRLSNSGGGNGIFANRTHCLVQNIDFGAIDRNGLVAGKNSFVQIIGSYTISGGGTGHYIADSSGVFTFNGAPATVTISGTPAFTSGFAIAQMGGVLIVTAATYSGAATGPRFFVFLNAVINTGGLGATYFPGDSAGITQTGGQYN